MAFNSAKGLLNPVGENNCFLNCAVQVFWHLDVFRRNFRLLSGHACLGSSCVFCALKAVFAQYQFSERPALLADSLRRALAKTFAGQRRFQMGFMDDASECFENILLHIHRHVSPDQADDSCSAPHCLPHQKFTMKIKEQVLCQCRSISRELSFDQMVHYVATTSLMTQVQRWRAERIQGKTRSFGQLLKDAKSDGEARKCSSNCGRFATIHRTLANMPEVISIGLIWDSERPSFEHIRGVVNALSTELQPQDLFDVVDDPICGFVEPFQLVGIICYYSHHYSTFFFHSKMKTWVSFDDAKIVEMGPSWRSVVDRCCQGHYQPLLLLYTKTTTVPIDVTAALATTFVDRQSEQYWSCSSRNHGSNQASCMPPNETNYQPLMKTASRERPAFLQSDLNRSFETSESRSTLVDSASDDSVSDGNVGRGSSSDRLDNTSKDHVRQPSYLYAITGPKSFYDNEAFSSYVAALESASSEERTRTRSSYDSVEQQGTSLWHNAPMKSAATNQHLTNSVGLGDHGRVRSNGNCNTLPYKSRSRDNSERSGLYQSYSHQNSPCGLVGDGWISRPGSAPCIRPPPPMVKSSASDFQRETHAVGYNSGKLGRCAVGRTVEKDDGLAENQYISATKVQSVLTSQGLRTRRCWVQGADGRVASRAAQNAGNPPSVRCVVGQSAIIAGCESNSVENVSVESHKDSGYRSGESNEDRGSPSSVLSSPSVDSGEFLPARNAQAIAQDFLRSGRRGEDRPDDVSGLTVSLDSLRSGPSSGVACRRQRKAPVMGTIQEIDCYSNKDSVSLPGNEMHKSFHQKAAVYPYLKDTAHARTDRPSKNSSVANPPRKLLQSDFL